MKTILLVVTLLAPAVAQPVARWTWTYDGPAGQWDQAWRVRCTDAGVFVSGDAQRTGVPLSFDMTAQKLTALGAPVWNYAYNGPGFYVDQAYDLTVTPDGRVYMAGSSWDLLTSNDFTVVAVSESGAFRWVEREADSGISIARAITSDADCNLYVCGTTQDYQRFTVLSLDSAGGERWRFSDSTFPGEAMAIARDSAGRTLCAGYRLTSDSTSDFQMLALDTAGGKLWDVGWSGMTLDTALAITTGEGWAYAAGHVMNPPPAGPDIFVMGVNIDDPQSPWSYAYDGGGGPDFARGIAYGADGNIYVSGVSYLPDSAGTALVVISLTAQGAYRWAYLDTGGRALALNIGGEIAVDPEGNSYVAGMLAGTAQTHMDAAVLSLTSGGTLRWRYTYARPDTGMDMLSSITRGPDGNLYACGLTGDPPSSDWLVVSLSPSGAVNEATGAGVTAHRPTLIVDAMNLAGTGPTTVVLDATGRIVARGELPAARLAALRSGVYFLRSGRDRHKLVKP